MATDANTQANEKKEPVTFTAEQQAKIDELIRDAMGRAGREARTELEQTRTQLTGLQTELTSAKEALKTATTPAQKAEAKGDIEALQAQIAEMRTAGQGREQELERLRRVTADKDKEVATARSEALNVRKRVAMRDAADQGKFIDIPEVVDNTDKFVRWDDTRGKFIVVNEAGQERMNSAYEPMSLEEFYTEYAAKKPYLVRSDARSGSGSFENKNSSLSNNGKYTVEQIFGKGSDSALANQLALTDKKEYQRLKAIAKANKLIP